MYKDRYLRNKILRIGDQELLKSSKVVVFGLGGLGGFVVEGLARMGVGELIIIDIDVFSESNLNRQRFCTEDKIGMPKVATVKSELSRINSEVIVHTIDERLSFDEIVNLLSDEKVKLVVDCLDTKKDKLSLEKACSETKKVLIHGAISGYIGEVATIYPDDHLLESIYKDKNDVDDEYGNTSFTPMLVAAFQVSEAIKVLIDENVDHGELIYIDLKNNEVTKLG